MAYATSDRLGRIKVNPQPKKEGFPLPDGEVIFAHTLFGVRAADGMAVNLEGEEAGVSAVLYADEHLEEGFFNDRVLAGAPYAVTVEGLSDIVVYLNGDGTFAAGDEGGDAFLVDDNTVAPTDNAGARPYVGKVEKVISADYVAVYIPGLYRD